MYLVVPFNCTIRRVTLLADQSGSIVVDVQTSSYSGFPGSLSSIVASDKPTLSSRKRTRTHADRLEREPHRRPGHRLHREQRDDGHEGHGPIDGGARMIVGYSRAAGFAYTVTNTPGYAPVAGGYVDQQATYDGQEYYKNANGVYLAVHGGSKWGFAGSLGGTAYYTAETITGTWVVGTKSTPVPTVVAG